MSNIRKFEDSDPEIRKLNEGIIKNNPALRLIDERVLYDKSFLLEVQAAGYNPLDAEDVQNFLENKAAKNQERNMILSGADKFKYLGQGEYEEDSMAKFLAKPGMSTSVKRSEDIHLSDLKGTQRELLLENAKEIDTDLSGIELPYKPSKYKNVNEAEDTLRRNMAKVFGSDDIEIKRTDIPEHSNLPMRQNDNIDKTLELIKELKALGFTPEEIKKEIQLRYK